jgi:hypothetical protein
MYQGPRVSYLVRSSNSNSHDLAYFPPLKNTFLNLFVISSFPGPTVEARREPLTLG